MPATIQRESANTYVLNISGILKKSELGGVQDKTAGDIDAGVKPRILTLLENFEGFEPGAAWGDLDFLYFHASEIEKVAIVGEPEWEHHALAFAGAGFRSAPVKFFPSSQQVQARAWLAE
jgi:universal stress protein A